MTEPPDLTVCVPAYHAAAFVGETLESLRRQTYPRFKVLVSVDPSDDPTLAVCRAWEAYDPFEVIGQPEPLGWPGNVNWLLQRVDTPLTCIILHDDWVAPDYLQRLAARLHQEPGAVLAYGDIQAFGTVDLEISQPSLTGDPFDRVLSFLLDRHNAVEWRGVVRTHAVQRTQLLRHDANGFAADILWLLELAAVGEFVREPGAIYHKRYRDGSITAGWMARSPAQAALDWVEHGVACLDVALAARDWTVAQRQYLAAAALARAIRFVHAGGHDAPSPPDLAALVVRVAHVALRGAGVLPDGTALPCESELPPTLRTWVTETLGRLVPPGDAHLR